MLIRALTTLLRLTIEGDMRVFVDETLNGMLYTLVVAVLAAHWIGLL
jgi:hypothetical protein